MMGNHYGGIPRTLRVGPFTFNVKVMAELPDDDLGGYSSSKLLITLKGDQPSAAFAADTFLHEVMHAIYANTGLSESEEEQACTALTAGLIDVFSRNPRFLGWLKETLEGKKNG